MTPCNMGICRTIPLDKLRTVKDGLAIGIYKEQYHPRHAEQDAPDAAIPKSLEEDQHYAQ